MTEPVRLLWPVPQNSIITRTFDEHVQLAKNKGWCYTPGKCPSGTYYYGGIDWGIPTGTYIDAPMSGRAEVQNQGNLGYGLNLRITGKDGYYVILAHLQHVNFRTGDDVVAGEICAASDNTGNSTGPHVHFELRHNGVPIDPMPYLVGEVKPEPDPGPSPMGDLVKVGRVYRAVALRTKPDHLEGLLMRINGVSSPIFEQGGEVFSDGRKWTKAICYIASDYVEPA